MTRHCALYLLNIRWCHCPSRSNELARAEARRTYDPSKRQHQWPRFESHNLLYWELLSSRLSAGAVLSLWSKAKSVAIRDRWHSNNGAKRSWSLKFLCVMVQGKLITRSADPRDGITTRYVFASFFLAWDGFDLSHEPHCLSILALKHTTNDTGMIFQNAGIAFSGNVRITFSGSVGTELSGGVMISNKRMLRTVHPVINSPPCFLLVCWYWCGALERECMPETRSSAVTSMSALSS